MAEDRVQAIREGVERRRANNAVVVGEDPGVSAFKLIGRAGDDDLAFLLDELDRLHTWSGLMSLLDEHYPAEVFDGSSGDLGARIVTLTRALDAVLQARATIEGRQRDEIDRLRFVISSFADCFRTALEEIEQRERTATTEAERLRDENAKLVELAADYAGPRGLSPDENRDVVSIAREALSEESVDAR